MIIRIRKHTLETGSAVCELIVGEELIDDIVCNRDATSVLISIQKLLNENSPLSLDIEDKKVSDMISSSDCEGINIVDPM